MNNPLLDFSDTPLFDAIQPEHVPLAMEVLLAQSDAALETVTAVDYPVRWTEIAKVLDVTTEKLGRASALSAASSGA